MTTDPMPERIRRAATGAVFAFSIALGNLGWSYATVQRLGGAAVGLLLAGGLARLWGERTRPKAGFLWWVLGAIILAVGVVGGTSFWLPAALGVFVGLFLAHDMRLTPTLMITATVADVLWQPGKRWTGATEADAWSIALATLVSIAAALLERDRLARRQGPPMPAAWTGMRLGFLIIWTVAVLSLKKQLQAGRLFASLGIDPNGFGGQMTLLAVVIAALVLAGLVFRTRTPKAARPAPPPDFVRNS